MSESDPYTLPTEEEASAFEDIILGTSLEPWQTSVEEEREALSARLSELKTYLAEAVLPRPRKDLLRKQAGAMATYLDVLEQRIARF